MHLETPSQLGKPGAVNLGLEHATGEYIWGFDDDDVALPDALARVTDALERHPECGFSWSPWFVADTMPDGSLGPATFETREPDIATIGFLPALLERNFLGGAALFARASGATTSAAATTRRWCARRTTTWRSGSRAAMRLRAWTEARPSS